MSRKHKKVCTTLNYYQLFLILASTITGCISTSAFASLVAISTGITSSAIRLKFCTIAVGIKWKKKHEKIVFLGKCNLNSVES